MAYLSDNKIEIWPLDRIYQLCMPEDLALDIVAWEIDRYSFSLNGRDLVLCLNEQQFQEEFYHGYTIFFHPHQSAYKILAIESLPERNALKVRYRYSEHADDSSNDWISIFYQIVSEEKRLYVRELYTRSNKLVNILLYGMDHGAYFYGLIHLESPPSREWLPSFGLEPIS